MLRPSHSSRFYHPHNCGWAVQIVKLNFMRFYTLPCELVQLSPKYSPQHPILKHPQPTFLPLGQRPSFTPIQTNRQNSHFFSGIWPNAQYLTNMDLLRHWWSTIISSTYVVNLESRMLDKIL
jgi:hypothetical protein